MREIGDSSFLFSMESDTCLASYKKIQSDIEFNRLLS